MTNDDNGGGLAVLKRDGRGRVRSTKEQRFEVVAQFDRSGLSGPAFCKVAGINYQTFVGWRKASRRDRCSGAVSGASVAAPSAGIRFLEASLPTVQCAAHAVIEVCLTSGARVLVTDATQVPLVAQLIKALA